VDALASLPDDARLWLFAADRDFDGAAAGLLEDVRAFTDRWQSHGRPVVAAADVIDDRVLAVAGAISTADWNAGVPGCGIDAMTRAVGDAATSRSLEWVGGLDVVFREGSAWRVVPRGEFRRLARAGAVTPATVVLDLTIDTVGALRAGGAARPAGETWHGGAFWATAPAD
jgi:hypothetical protein